MHKFTEIVRFIDGVEGDCCEDMAEEIVAYLMQEIRDRGTVIDKLRLKVAGLETKEAK
jgi:hypothetical protein